MKVPKVSKRIEKNDDEHMKAHEKKLAISQNKS